MQAMLNTNGMFGSGILNGYHLVKLFISGTYFRYIPYLIRDGISMAYLQDI